MMKHFICLLVALLGMSGSLMSSSIGVSVVKGVVVYDGKSDFHIIETGSFFVLCEWYSGPDFSSGDVITGELHSYGFKMVRVNNKETSTKIYIENYWTSKDKCFDWLREHGKLK
jgi:hypothetical protein